MTRHLRVGTEVLIWSGLCFGVWLFTLSSVTPHEMVLAAFAAVLVAVCAVRGRRAAAAGRWRVRPWLTWYLGLPVAILLDAVRLRLLVHSTRRRLGKTPAAPLPADEPEDVPASR